MSYVVDLYYNGSDTHDMNKALTAVALGVTCELKAPVDVVNPEITINATDAHDRVNYAYIAEFGRYYYAKPITKNGQVITYELKSDALMSFKTGIKASKCVISRNPWHFDMYLPDSKLPIEERKACAVLKFPVTDAFSGANNSYILTTIGSTSS